MSWFEAASLLAAGVAAGAINVVVGSGSLITFPALLAFGYPPVLANVTNNIGILPGSVSGVIAYRRELRGNLRKLIPLFIFSALGGLAGALLLLVLPAAAFDGIVPILILIACVLVVAAPRLKRWSQARAARPRASAHRQLSLVTGVGLSGIYGGYFGAAQGVILLSMLSILLEGGLQRANAYKNVLTTAANGSAAVVFVMTTDVAWLAAGIIAIGAFLGGQIGGSLGRRLPPLVFRLVILAVGIIAVIYFVMK